MKFEIKHQENYSRGELLLRSFFGFIYIIIPHGICLAALGIVSAVFRFLTFWIILFTGNFPENFFHFQVRFLRWALRVHARMFHLADGYPAFGLNAADDNTHFDITYNPSYSRGMVVLVGLLGALLLIPHIFCVWFLMIGVMFVAIVSWFVVLFTGKYNAGMHEYMVNTLRWMYRINVYMQFMDARYPPFSGRPDDELVGEKSVIDN